MVQADILTFLTPLIYLYKAKYIPKIIFFQESIFLKIRHRLTHFLLRLFFILAPKQGRNDV